MTIEEHIEAMAKMFGDKLPNYEQEPIRFKWFVKMYKLYNGS